MSLDAVTVIRHVGLDAFCQKFAIKAARHKRYPHLVQLKYDQIESPMSERCVRQCRGLILDESNDWQVVCRPYDKFFNVTEGHAAQIDWSTARAYEKLDGSIISLYHYGSEWHVASSGLPDASGPVCRDGPTFAELFWQTWRKLGYCLPPDWNDTTFIFELLTPLNRIIVPQSNSRIVLHGVRHRRSGLEDHPERYAKLLGWECVRSFPLASVQQCLDAAQQLNPMSQEGFVVVDGQFNRVKIKSPQYVALAHLKEGRSSRRLLEIVRANESDEFLSYFPEWREPYERMADAFHSLVTELEAAYASIEHLQVQKDFAIQACRTRCSSALFALRAGKVKSIRDYLATASIGAVERAMGVLPSLQDEPAELRCAA